MTQLVTGQRETLSGVHCLGIFPLRAACNTSPLALSVMTLMGFPSLQTHPSAVFALSMMVPWVSAKPRHSLTLSRLRCLGLVYFGYGPMA
jgi:hypothetical protein